ncbi:MAG TPA: S53 family serine peptidase [Verrucomicrobiae bacterium]|jgi:subtilase family serine protease
MKLTSHTLLLGLAVFAAKTHAADRLAIKSHAPLEARRQVLSRLPGTNRLELAIGLPLRNRPAMTNLLHDVYDARGAKFHQYLTPVQFAEQFGPTAEDYEKVKAFARSNHLTIKREFGNRALVNVVGTVADIENAFQVHLGWYQHPAEKRQFFAPDTDPTVTSGLSVLYIQGMDNYLIPRPQGHSVPLDKTAGPHAQDGSGVNGLYVGSDYRHAYVPGTTLKGAGQALGLFELDGYTPGDITKYESLAGRNAVPLYNILNSLAPGSGNDEVCVDIQSAVAMAPNLAAINVYEEPNGSGNDATIINEMASPTQGELLPSQISCSWGIENDTDIVQGLLELALQGQSFFYALGDNGAYQNGMDGNTAGSLVYMVAVGGTELFMTNNGAKWIAENVWHDVPGTNYAYFATAGGILTDVPIPDYQQPVSMALNHGSTQFRNVPDVALVARDIEGVVTGTNSSGKYVETGQVGGYVGTSISAPLWAGIAALMNEQAADDGKPPVGFLLPAIYNIAQSSAYSACFHDITAGNNSWNDTKAGTSSDGLYTAAAGYDLCTGWGSCAGTNLINTLMDFTGPVFVDFHYQGQISAGTYAKPYKTLAQGVSAVTYGGTIIIKTAGTSSETMTIKKAMDINVNDGAATIGKH